MKSSNKIYTTIDGVKLFAKEDSVYCPETNSMVTVRVVKKVVGKKYFSSEQAFKDWLRVQPVLCFNDLRDHIAAGELCYFENLAKEKALGKTL